MEIEPAPAATNLQPHATGERLVLPAHVPSLDGLRGTAILLVFLFHLMSPLPPTNRVFSYLNWLKESGWAGVDLFFVLSGFLITGILIEARSHNHYFKNFYVRRILRIFPLYYFTLVVLLIILPLLRVHYEGYDTIVPHQAWLWAHASNIYMTVKQGWAFGSPGVSLEHFWSLAVEEHFYLVWPAIVFFTRPAWLARVCCAIIVLAVGIRLACLACGLSVVTCYTLTICRMDSLALGGLLAVMIRHGKFFSLLSKYSAWTFFIFGAALCILIRFRKGLYWNDRIVQSFGYTALAVFFGSLLFLTITGGLRGIPQRFFSSAFLRFFGKYSYAMYIFHQPIRNYLSRWISAESLSGSLHSAALGTIAFLIIAAGATVLVSLLTWTLIERPCLSLKRYFPR